MLNFFSLNKTKQACEIESSTHLCLFGRLLWNIFWADRCSNRNENTTWPDASDKQNKFRIVACKKSVARKIFHGLFSMSLFRGASSKKNLKMANFTFV